MGWVGSAMGYYRLLGDVSTPISTNYPLTVYTEYTGIVIQTRTCRAVGYWSSLAPEYHVLPTSPSPAVTRPYTSLLVLPRPESHPVSSHPTVRFSVPMPVARSEVGYARYRLNASIRGTCFELLQFLNIVNRNNKPLKFFFYFYEMPRVIVSIDFIYKFYFFLANRLTTMT